MVRRTQLAVGHTAAHATEFDVGVRVGQVGLDLFERPPGQEGGRATDKGDQTAVGQSGAHPDHVLLGDAHVDEPDRVHLAELVQLARADRVVDDGDDALILRCELAELIFKGIATIIELGHEVTSSSSLRAVASSSALTPWLVLWSSRYELSQDMRMFCRAIIRMRWSFSVRKPNRRHCRHLFLRTFRRTM